MKQNAYRVASLHTVDLPLYTKVEHMKTIILKLEFVPLILYSREFYHRGGRDRSRLVTLQQYGLYVLLFDFYFVREEELNGPSIGFCGTIIQT